MNFGAILFPAMTLAAGVVYLTMAIHMPRGNLAQPGPGLYPMIVGIFWVLTSFGCLLHQVIRRLKENSDSKTFFQAENTSSNSHPIKAVKLMALMVIYVLALKPVGFPIAISVFLFVAIRLFGYPKSFYAIIMAVVMAILSYILFVLLLKVPLPMGILDDFLG
jgi:putative tricarboxylic transport membrane protein